jgi:uncharacterized protein
MLDLRAQIQSDLQWLCDCPDLVDFGSEFPQPAYPPLKDPLWETVEEHLHSRASHRVGYYVETLIEVWLGTIPGVADIQRGIQIQDGKTTRGELDFLYQKDGRLHHLEVALKFFLHLPNPAGGSPDSVSEFPGPNAQDNFEKKRDKILHSQLPLGQKCFPAIAESRALVKGMIFYHPLQELPSVLPEKMNPNHARGMWIRSTELELLRERFPECRGSIMKKPFWLAGEAASLPLPELTTTLQEHFIGSDSPVLLFLRSGKESGQIEVERLFVVSPAWPGSGRSGGR